MGWVSEVEQSLARIHRELRLQGEQLQRVMAMRLGEMEARLEGRLDAARQPTTDAAVEPERSPVARKPEYVRTEAAQELAPPSGER